MIDHLKNAMGWLNGDKTQADIKSPADQSPDTQKLVAYINEKVMEARNTSSRVANEGIWMTNIAYSLGFSGTYYDTTLRQYVVVGRPNNLLKRNRIHVNKVMPSIQRRSARLCKNLPRYEVKPENDTEEAKEKARLEEQILNYYWDKLKIQEKRVVIMQGIQTCGHYYLHVNWDKTQGKIIGIDENGFAVNEGEPSVDLVNPLEVFPDPLATTFDELRYLIRTKVRPLEYFRRHYKLGHLVKEEDAFLLNQQFQARINTLTGQAPAQTSVQNQTRNSAIEIAYYEKPSELHPKGRLVVIANGILLQDDDLPCGEIPFVRFDDIVIAGKYYPEATVTHARPIQDQFNRLIGRRAQWVNLMLAGKFIAAKGSEIDSEAINDQNGEVVYYRPVPNAAPPSAMPIPQIPSYAYEEETRLNEQFYDIFGEGDVSRGILPSSTIPAIGMQLLLEQDESRLAITTEQHEHAFARLGKLILLNVEKNATEERIIKVTGESGKLLFKSYSSESLKSDHDVIVKQGSLAASSKAVNRNDIVNLMSLGLLGSVQDPSVATKVLTALEFGDVGEVYRDYTLDMNQIKKTIEQIENGIMPDVHEMDNHALHIQEKNRYRKSDKFDSLDSRRQAILEQNMEMHVQAAMKLRAPQFGMTPNPQSQVMQDTSELTGGAYDATEEKAMAATEQLAQRAQAQARKLEQQQAMNLQI